MGNPLAAAIQEVFMYAGAAKEHRREPAKEYKPGYGWISP